MSKKKVVTLEDRIPKLKHQRKQKANRRLIFYVSFFFLLIAIIVYFQSPFSHIQTIRVSGNHFITTEEIIHKSGLSEATNYWTFDEDKTIKRIESLEQVKEAKIKKHLPNKVEIMVEEFNRVAYLEKDGKYYPILQNGEILDSIDQNTIPVNAPILVDWKENDLQVIGEELRKLDEGILHRISEIHLTPKENNPYQLTVYMNDGNVVITTYRDFAKKMTPYPSIIEELGDEKGIIHMTESPWLEPFYRKPVEEKKGEETTNESQR